MSSTSTLFRLSAAVLLTSCFAGQVNEHAHHASVVCQSNSLTWDQCQFNTGVPPWNQQKCFAGINTGQNAQGGSCSVPSPANGCVLVADWATKVWRWESASPFVSCCNCWQAKNPNPPAAQCPEDCKTPKCVSGSPQVAGSKQLVAGKCHFRCSQAYTVGGAQERYCGTGANFEMAGSLDCSQCKQNFLIETEAHVATTQAKRHSSVRLRASIGSPVEEGEATSMLQVSADRLEHMHEEAEGEEDMTALSPEEL